MSIRIARPLLSFRPILGGEAHRQHDVQHDLDVAHDGIDPWNATHDAFRCGRPTDVDALSRKPDSRPYTAEAAAYSAGRPEPRNSATAARSARLDFSEADRIDDDELNDILWRAIRKQSRPLPVRSYFVALDAAHLRLLSLAHAPALL